jgi:hypothetical protein
MNWYAYVGNDPMNKVDPSGESTMAFELTKQAAKTAVVASPAAVAAGVVTSALWPTKMGDGTMYKDDGSDVPMPESSGDESKPSLLDDKAKNHTLDGDSNGGGHRAGTNRPGKSEFPADWSDGKIEGEISDVATDPSITNSKPDGRGYVTAEGERDGIRIKAVIDMNKGRIVTGYPTNTPRNKK